MTGLTMIRVIKGFILAIEVLHFQVVAQLCNTPDWLEYEESQYLIINYQGRIYNEAMNFCRSQGGDLAIITSKDQNDFLVTHTMKREEGWNYWIGLHDLDDDGVFTWINKTELGFSNWLSDPSPDERCVRMISTYSDLDQGKWQTSSCSQLRLHICQRPLNPRCSWHLVHQSFFRIYEEGKEFEDARAECQSDGGDLAIIGSDEINSLLGRLITTNPLMNQCYWFGLRDVGRNDTFVWINGTRISEAESRWATRQAIHASKDCACIPANVGDSWTKHDCSTTQPYICERPRVLPEKWREINRVLYYMPSHQTNYFEAKVCCKQLGGMLAQLKTADISRAISAFIDNFGRGFWFGLDDLRNEGDFRWADGTLLDNTGFSDWDTDEPNNVQGYEHCVKTTIEGWRDVFCTNNHRFICEISKAPPLHLQAVTSASLGSMESSPQYTCVLSPPDDKPESRIFTERQVQQSWSEEGYTLDVPGVTSEAPGRQLTQTLPANDQSVGVYKCSSTDTSTGASTSVAVTILSIDRHFEPEDGRLTRTIFPGENMTLSITKKDSYVGDDDQIRWRTFSNLVEGSLSPMSDGSLVFEVNSVTDDDADVYGTYHEGHLESLQYSLIRVIVNACPEGRWGVPFCDRLCDNCYNGGVCHPPSGTCICAPGFSGRNCLRACGKHKFGWDCELSCGPEKCSGSRVCLPDPYGCSCLPGYTGINCNKECPGEKFGVNCLQECHCIGGASCDSFTGRCEGNCEAGWSGEGCQVPSVCLEGYFGVECTDHCNCPENSFCDRESGYCTQSEGVCEIGYSAVSAAFPESCSKFTGCFDSCTKTCHCSGGLDDCDQKTGICSSHVCHPRWFGENCQRGIMYLI